ncbi:hypothetical protein E2562_002786 [Oryza meyeriana var. granulata]|uniref:Uncharacterized protein n=1 Tax=Oryza meyeriana var. granulata TaxID=110450 RepID=A0A6G1BRL3_9ORYZ|nr:hypothetical protein E2562_002786 [Oryza meyeriana var. granulata]
MRGLSLALAVLVVVVVLLASGSDEVLAVRIPAAFAETSRRSASPAERPREFAEGNNAVATAAAFDASVKPAAATATGSSPSKVFDPDRMSKRRVRRGSDPIHNKC